MGSEDQHGSNYRHELMDSGFNQTPRYTTAPTGHDTGLFRVDRPGVAWDWMTQTGQAPNRSDWVRPQVAESWSRCIGAYDLVPGARLPLSCGTIETIDARAAGANALPGGKATLANIAFSLHSLLRNTSVTLLMADPSATLIHVMEAGLALGPSGRRLVALGARWQEPVLGNNGLGTAAVLRETVAFDGKEHFAAELHPYATIGHPVCGLDGQLVAILGLITDQRDSASALLCFLRLAGHLVEASLFEQLRPCGYTLRLRPTGLGAGVAVEDCLLDGLIAVEEDGQITGATSAALTLLGFAGHSDALGHALEDVLGVPVERVLAEPCLDDRALEVRASNGRLLTVQLICGRELEPARPTGRAVGEKMQPRAAGRCKTTPPPREAGHWRDAVLEAALQKALSAQKQKIALLITGESGVGKDHLVRRMHDAGPRQGRPLVLINCAAIPRDLISTELFGYEAGSFTGARTKGKQGKFLDAHTGTLFLDEIGDMALDLQAALLCALDNSEIVPVGGTRPIVVDVQVVAATNSQLQDRVRKGTFRRDLYYRLNGAQICLPPLRERPDKLGLIMHLWNGEMRAQGRSGDVFISDEVLAVFEQHPWPGNIRELRNVLRSCMATMAGPELAVADLPYDFMEEMSEGVGSPLPGMPEMGEGPEVFPLPEGGALSASEMQTIRWALEAGGGNISKTAKQLGITRATLYHKMARYGLRKPS